MCVCVCEVSPLQLLLVVLFQRKRNGEKAALLMSGGIISDVCVYENRNVCQMCLNHFTVISHTLTHTHARAHIERERENLVTPSLPHPLRSIADSFHGNPASYLYMYTYTFMQNANACQKQVHGTVYDKVDKHHSSSVCPDRWNPRAAPATRLRNNTVTTLVTITFFKILFLN